MDKDTPFNIFSGDSRSGEEKRKHTPPSPPSITDSETDEMLEKLHEMDKEIQQRINIICQMSGMSKEEVQRFLENPSNFPPEKWAKMQREKEALEEKIYQAVGIEVKKKQLLFKKKKIEQQRKGKTLGGRKGWIQM